MAYFVEFYDPAGNHVGTRSLFADTDANATHEARSLLCMMPTWDKTTIRLFRQSAKENVTEIATISR